MASHGKNDVAWEKLFDKYDIINEITCKGIFTISAEQIREFREPRLMAKFDHKINLPHVFTANSLSILPVSRGTYCISHFDSYQQFPDIDAPIQHFSLPEFIQTIDPGNITSETISISAALASGVFYDFAGEDILSPTVSGRMGSGSFNFAIKNTRCGQRVPVCVNNAQIEIDAALEGIGSLLLVEAKLDLSQDFIIRQLFYPLRTWASRVPKQVRPVFLLYSNSIFRLYEYEFVDLHEYNSIQLKKYGRYSIEDTHIEIGDVMHIVKNVTFCPEPEIPFPQADDFRRIINLCELLYENDLGKEEITTEYAFDTRQTSYYTDAGRYLGIIAKEKIPEGVRYRLTERGRQILCLPYKRRQLAFCDAILRHKVFWDVFTEGLRNGQLLDKKGIIFHMRRAGLYNVESDSTYSRRSSTIKCWLDWIASLWRS